jgi:hypothetical protein
VPGKKLVEDDDEYEDDDERPLMHPPNICHRVAKI